MSWSKSTSGPPAKVIDDAERWPDEVDAIDHTWATDAIRSHHQAQVRRCIEAIKEFAGHLPLGYHMTASANGHADGKQSDTCNVNMGAYKPVPIEAVAA